MAEERRRAFDSNTRTKPRRPTPTRRRSNPLKMGVFWVMAVAAMQRALGTTQETDPEGQRTHAIPRAGGHMWNMFWEREEILRLPRDDEEVVTLEQQATDGKEKWKPISVISANVHSLRPRAEIVAAWKADIVAVQETKLAPHAIAETSTILSGRCYRLAHGAPCQPQQYRKDAKVTHAANEANSGGVAIITQEHLRTISDDLAAQLPALHETARWTELKVPVRGRTKYLTIASFYGISGSSSNDRKYRANEELLSDAIKRAIEAGDAPYLLCGDFNVDPRDSQAIAAAVNSGLLVDIGHEWATTWTENEDGEVAKQPENTLHREGPTEGLKGKGATRIDTIQCDCFLQTKVGPCGRSPRPVAD